MELGFSFDGRYSDSYLASGFGNPLSEQDSFVTIDAGIRFGADDRNWQIAVIGKNLTNEFFITYDSDTVRVTDSRRFFSGRGRTFTLSLRSEF